jgi:hypothetical protein
MINIERVFSKTKNPKNIACKFAQKDTPPLFKHFMK